jgi:hypothetical protein
MIVPRDFGGCAKEEEMPKESSSVTQDLKTAMERRKEGKLKSGKGGKGGTVKNRKQAIAIGLSEARKKGKKVPRKTAAKAKPAPKRQ